MLIEQQFAKWFKCATSHNPYPFQIRSACDRELPQLVVVPTGMGKTAMAVLGWLWQRRFVEEEIRKAHRSPWCTVRSRLEAGPACQGYAIQ